MITFFSHLRVDGEDRLRNLQTVLNYYSKEFPEAKFIIVEDDASHNEKLNNIKWPKGSALYFLHNSGAWHKTKALNAAVNFSKTKYVIQLDIDCIFDHLAIKKCIQMLEDNDDVHYGFPYNGYVLDLNYHYHHNFINKDYDYDSILNNIPPLKDLPLGYADENLMVRCTNKDHLGVGGMVIFKKKHYCENGGYNPHFICWGGDDNEIDKRFIKLGLKSCRVVDDRSLCFHLPHSNAIRFQQNPYYNHNYKELAKMESMDIDQLKEYIAGWKCCD
jgi:predicted glycosyltransferase involved in capsule biosynthesis